MTAVLIADDDADIRDLVAFKLEQSELEVVAVGDGVAALEAARARRPEIAVLDVSCPGCPAWTYAGYSARIRRRRTC